MRITCSEIRHWCNVERWSPTIETGAGRSRLKEITIDLLLSLWKYQYLLNGIYLAFTDIHVYANTAADLIKFLLIKASGNLTYKMRKQSLNERDDNLFSQEIP